MSRVADVHFGTAPPGAFEPSCGRMRLHGGKGGDAPAPPDYGPIAAANAEASRYAYEAAGKDLDFRKQVYEESKPRQQQLYEMASKVADQQMGIADESAARGREQWGQYKSTYLPNEQMTVADAYGQQYLDPTERARLISVINGQAGLDTAGATGELARLSGSAEDRAAQQAMTQSSAGINSAFAQQSRALMRMGGDPNRLAAAAASMAQGQALAKVGAANSTREAVRGKLLGLRSGVANFGRNMPNTAGQAFGLSTQAGSSATANQNAGFMSGLPYAQYQSGGFGQQMAAAGQAQQGALGMGGLLNGQYGTMAGVANAQSAADGQSAAGAGAAVGMMAAAFI